jgi:hypothetical protein
VSKGAVGLFVGVAVLALGALVTGCGGGSSALTKQEFVKQGNAICAKGSTKREVAINEMGQQLGIKGRSTTAQQEKLVTAALPTYEEMTAELAELSPPEGEEKKVEAIISAMEEAAERVGATPSSALASNAPFEKPDKLASEYGLKNCVV